MDFGLERTAVGLCGRLELPQDVIIQITNQYVGHSRVEPPVGLDGIILIPDRPLYSSGAARAPEEGLLTWRRRPGMTRETGKAGKNPFSPKSVTYVSGMDQQKLAVRQGFEPWVELLGPTTV